MMAEGNLGAPQLLRRAIENTSAQAGAEGAGGFAFRYLVLDDGIGIFFNDLEVNAQGCQVLRQHMLGEARLLLIQVDGHQIKMDGGACLQAHQDVEHGKAVLAAGQAHHDLVALFNHVEVGDGLTYVAPQALLQFVETVFIFGVQLF